MMSRSVVVVALLLLGVLACAGVVQGEEGGQVAAVGEPEWEKCVHIHDVGEACVEITVDEADLSLTIALVIANHTVLHETVSANQTLCVNLDTLLDLVGDVCIPCKPVIKLIEEFGHKITNEILNACVDIQDVVWGANEVSGDVEFVYHILCWKGKCVTEGQDDLGSFHIHF